MLCAQKKRFYVTLRAGGLKFSSNKSISSQRNWLRIFILNTKQDLFMNALLTRWHQVQWLSLSLRKRGLSLVSRHGEMLLVPLILPMLLKVHWETFILKNFSEVLKCTLRRKQRTASMEQIALHLLSGSLIWFSMISTWRLQWQHNHRLFKNRSRHSVGSFFCFQWLEKIMRNYTMNQYLLF